MYVLLADDQFDVRVALKCLLQNECDLELLSEVASASELLEHLCLGCPDLVLLDWELPGSRGSSLVRQIHACCPTIQVIALSVRPEARDEALAAGVQGFISKGDPPECVVTAVRQMRGLD